MCVCVFLCFFKSLSDVLAESPRMYRAPSTKRGGHKMNEDGEDLSECGVTTVQLVVGK